VLDDEERDDLIRKLNAKKRGNAKIEVTRFKGLGEMNPPQLKETTMDPATRRLVQLTLTEDNEEKVFSLMDMLLANKRAADRRDWLAENGYLADIED
jgi:topoisomerase-4 subunit B